MSEIKLNKVMLQLAVASTLNANLSNRAVINLQLGIIDRTSWRGGSKKKGGKTKWPIR